MATVLTAQSKLSVALDLHPDILEYIVSLNPHDFKRLRNPLMRQLMPPRITLQRVANMVDIPVAEILENLHQIAGIELTSDELTSLDSASFIIPMNADEQPDWVENDLVTTVDLLESDEKLDADPMPPISRALFKLQPGEVMLVKHKWEPQPLYDIWIRTGTDYYSQQQSPDEWWIYLRKGQKLHAR